MNMKKKVFAPVRHEGLVGGVRQFNKYIYTLLSFYFIIYDLTYFNNIRCLNLSQNMTECKH